MAVVCVMLVLLLHVSVWVVLVVLFLLFLRMNLGLLTLRLGSRLYRVLGVFRLRCGRRRLWVRLSVLMVLSIRLCVTLMMLWFRLVGPGMMLSIVGIDSLVL